MAVDNIINTIEDMTCKSFMGKTALKTGYFGKWSIISINVLSQLLVFRVLYAASTDGGEVVPGCHFYVTFYMYISIYKKDYSCVELCILSLVSL